MRWVEVKKPCDGCCALGIAPLARVTRSCRSCPSPPFPKTAPSHESPRYYTDLVLLIFFFRLASFCVFFLSKVSFCSSFAFLPLSCNEVLRDVFTRLSSFLVRTIAKPMYLINIFFIVLTVINKLQHHILLWFVPRLLRDVISLFPFRNCMSVECTHILCPHLASSLADWRLQ